MSNLPDWLEKEWPRAILAGDLCTICGCPRPICDALGPLIQGLAMLSKPCSSAHESSWIGGLSYLAYRPAFQWCWSFHVVV